MCILIKKKTHHTQTVLFCVSSVLSLCLQDSVVSKYRPLEELKRDMAQLEVLVETDAQVHQSVFEIKVFTVSQSSWRASLLRVLNISLFVIAVLAQS